MKLPSLTLVAATGAFAYVVLGSTNALAAHPGPICTTEPQSKWLPEARVRARLGRMGYRHIQTMQVSGSCYVVHALTRDHRHAELYLNPVAGVIVQNDVK